MKGTYSEAEIAYLKKNFMLPTAELVEGLTLISGDVKTCKSVYNKLAYLNLLNGRPRQVYTDKKMSYSSVELAFIKENYDKYLPGYLAELINEKFGKNRTEFAIEAQIRVIKKEERKEANKPNPPPRKKPALKKTRAVKPVLRKGVTVKGIELTDALCHAGRSIDWLACKLNVSWRHVDQLRYVGMTAQEAAPIAKLLGVEKRWGCNG